MLSIQSQQPWRKFTTISKLHRQCFGTDGASLGLKVTIKGATADVGASDNILDRDALIILLAQQFNKSSRQCLLATFRLTIEVGCQWLNRYGKGIARVCLDSHGLFLIVGYIIEKLAWAMVE